MPGVVLYRRVCNLVIVSDLLDIIILSQHYDMICSNSICLANLINVHAAERGCCHLAHKDNTIMLFIVLFFCRHAIFSLAPTLLDVLKTRLYLYD